MKRIVFLPLLVVSFGILLSFTERAVQASEQAAADFVSGDATQRQDREILKRFQGLSESLGHLPEPPEAKGVLDLSDFDLMVGAVEHEEGADGEEDVARPGA